MKWRRGRRAPAPCRWRRDFDPPRRLQGAQAPGAEDARGLATTIISTLEGAEVMARSSAAKNPVGSGPAACPRGRLIRSRAVRGRVEVGSTRQRPEFGPRAPRRRCLVQDSGTAVTRRPNAPRLGLGRAPDQPLRQACGRTRTVLLTGRIVGRGADHEPLVVDMRPVARIGDSALRTALQINNERFDVGDDSRD
jgi:hypothetical protein